MVLGKLNSQRQKIKTRSLSYTIPKSNSKWIKDLNTSLELIKLLRKKVGTKILDIDFRDDFLDLTPNPKATKAKTKTKNKKQMKQYQAKNFKGKSSAKRKVNLLNGRKYLQIIYIIKG